MENPRKSAFLLLLSLIYFNTGDVAAQMITGVWKGKINRQKVEVKIIQSGDSLAGTSYYYESGSNYRRYSIRGYFDPKTNAAIWWDDQLLDEKSGRLKIADPGRIPLLSSADFNCPGSGKMTLNGNSVKKEDNSQPAGKLYLDKSTHPDFPDEWDYVIDNYTMGTNDPDIIDSIANFVQRPTITPQVPDKRTVAHVPPPEQKAKPVIEMSPPVAKTIEPVKALSIEEKFVSRKNIFSKEIPVRGDSIELRFYDDAEIDGDSISLFLNGKLIFEHIGLTGKPYIIKLAVKDLKESNELIMVAENMGSIPPNTSYMIAMVGNQRYDAYLTSTEGSSAMIRFVKKDDR